MKSWPASDLESLGFAYLYREEGWRVWSCLDPAWRGLCSAPCLLSLDCCTTDLCKDGRSFFLWFRDIKLWFLWVLSKYVHSLSLGFQSQGAFSWPPDMLFTGNALYLSICVQGRGGGRRENTSWLLHCLYLRGIFVLKASLWDTFAIWWWWWFFYTRCLVWIQSDHCIASVNQGTNRPLSVSQVRHLQFISLLKHLKCVWPPIIQNTTDPGTANAEAVSGLVLCCVSCDLIEICFHHLCYKGTMHSLAGDVLRLTTPTSHFFVLPSVSSLPNVLETLA